MTEHREYMDDYMKQQHWSQKCNRMQERRLELEEQERTTVRKRDRFEAVQRKENSDLDNIDTS